jgi:hypothetical protein
MDIYTFRGPRVKIRKIIFQKNVANMTYDVFYKCYSLSKHTFRKTKFYNKLMIPLLLRGLIGGSGSPHRKEDFGLVKD